MNFTNIVKIMIVIFSKLKATLAQNVDYIGDKCQVIQGRHSRRIGDHMIPLQRRLDADIT